MKIPLAIADTINELFIAAPCPVHWDSMKGNDRVRHCEQCDKNVYDLSALTSVEIVQLIEEADGKFCGQLFRRRDGSVLTADCPVGFRLKIWKRLRRSMAWAASVFAMIFLPGCPMGGGNMRMPQEKLIAPKDRPAITPANANPPALGMTAPLDLKQAPAPPVQN